MQIRSIVFFLLVVGVFATPTNAQTFKRKPKGKATPVKPAPKAETPPQAALPEEEPNANPDRITTHELKRKMDAKEDILILDNRTGNAWLGSQVKIKGAVHLPFNELLNNIEKLPKDKEIITYCT